VATSRIQKGSSGLVLGCGISLESKGLAAHSWLNAGGEVKVSGNGKGRPAAAFPRNSPYLQNINAYLLSVASSLNDTGMNSVMYTV
jgi:hypothetical protein